MSTLGESELENKRSRSTIVATLRGACYLDFEVFERLSENTGEPIDVVSSRPDRCRRGEVRVRILRVRRAVPLELNAADRLCLPGYDDPRTRHAAGEEHRTEQRR